MNAQVNQVEAITEVKYMSVDAWLNLMADVFVQGMNHAWGLILHYNPYEPRYKQR